jgi:hypothetical protein
MFLISVIGHIFFSHYKKNSQTSRDVDNKFSRLKEITEFIFVIAMSLLLIIIFNPWFKHQIYINKEIAILFYLFGFITLITANWGIVFKEPQWFIQIKSSLKLS